MAIIGVSGKISSGKDTVYKAIQYLTAKKYSVPFEKMVNDTTMDATAWSRVSNWQNRKFADKLKKCVSLIIGIPRADLEKESVKNSNLPEEWDTIKFRASNGEHYHFGSRNDIEKYDKYGYDIEPMTVRRFLQRFGTEVVRELHADAWVNALMSDYKLTSIQKGIIDFNNCNVQLVGQPIVTEFPNWVVTDVRFPNEYEAIKKADGFLIRLIKAPVRDCNVCMFTGCQLEFKECNGTNVGNYKHASEIALDHIDFDYYIDNNGTFQELVEQVETILKVEKIL